jgi:hypothetical protein
MNVRSIWPTSEAAKSQMNRLRILHLNVGKRPAVQQSLLKDDTLKDFDAMTVLEPYIFRHPRTGDPTIAQDRRWEMFRLTTIRSDGHARHAFRAARASPYPKRWWTKELAVLRDGFTEKRNRITTMRCRGEDVAEAIWAADTARRMYHDEIDRQKKQHWKDFLNNPENIWKAARYAKGVNVTASIPNLTANNREYCTDEEKAGIFLSTFFPKQSEPVLAEQRTRQQSSRRESPTWPSLTRQEVERAIFKSSPDKSPGSDGIVSRVWRELWPAVGDHIVWLYSNSLDLGRIPKEWKTARIVTIRKPGKADYTVPKAFRPISLLQTISKGLEAVVAARLSYLTERFSLLPANHFGGWPRRSAEHALNVLVERIYQAWRNYKILTLVSFDVKGAFNGVHSEVLVRRLRDRRAPEQAVRWIADFCTDRKAQVIVASGRPSDSSSLGYGQKSVGPP